MRGLHCRREWGIGSSWLHRQQICCCRLDQAGVYSSHILGKVFSSCQVILLVLCSVLAGCMRTSPMWHPGELCLAHRRRHSAHPNHLLPDNLAISTAQCCMRVTTRVLGDLAGRMTG